MEEQKNWKQMILGGETIKLGDSIAVIYRAKASKSTPRTNIKGSDELLACRNAVAKRIIQTNDETDQKRFLAEGFDDNMKTRIRRFNIDRLEVIILSEAVEGISEKIKILAEKLGGAVYAGVFVGATDDEKGLYLLKAFSSIDILLD